MVFEFTVPGPPVSHQTHNKIRLKAWREKVRAAAAMAWGIRDPLAMELVIKVAYYHEGESVRIDNDNMVKPIQDALIGLIYPDDRWITDTIVRKTSIDGLFQIRGCPLVLIEAFSRGVEFLHIVVDRAPGHERLLK
jgi:crossover junction endodeoxyribonuclease RusA